MKPLQKKLTAFLAAFALIGFTSMATAQNTPEAPDTGTSEDDGTADEDGIAGFWEIILPGGKFMTSLNTITSISQHEYVVDGTARVYEVTVDTSGGVTARFYFLEPATDGGPTSTGKTAVDRVRELTERATDRSGANDIVWRSVVKNYPNTTHAKTTEFRLQYKENLDRIYKHIHRAWAVKDRNKSYRLRISDQ